MFRYAALPLLMLVAACGQSTDDRLEEAAEQSDPAAAQVLNEAAEAGLPPQEALERAGEAQVEQDLETSSTLQARPNLPESPNRPAAGNAPEKVDVARDEQAETPAASQDDHAGHDMGNGS